VAVDAAGNVFVADAFNAIIRKVTAAGVVTTIAGTADRAGGTDGAGSAARFFTPAGVVADRSCNVFVTDFGAVRKITSAGVVTTLAGVAGGFGSADGTGRTAGFGSPNGIAIDGAGNLYVADEGNHTIRKVTPAGVVTTLAGSAGMRGSADGTGAAARFNFPAAVGTDASGNVYVADEGNFTIRKITPAGAVTTLAGAVGMQGSVDDTGSAARFHVPVGIAVDATGNVFVADYGSHSIRKVTPAGVVTTLAGSAFVSGSADGTGPDARFNRPTGVAVDGAGNVLVTDNRAVLLLRHAAR
jgi:secreted PhoX family phosphatase